MPSYALDFEPKLLGINDFCVRYRIGRTKTYEEIAAGRLRSVLRGNRRYILAEDADAWLNNHHVAA